MLDDDRENPFAKGTEVSTDSPEREPILTSEPSSTVTPVSPTTVLAPRIESDLDRSKEGV